MKLYPQYDPYSYRINDNVCQLCRGVWLYTVHILVTKC